MAVQINTVQYKLKTVRPIKGVPHTHKKKSWDHSYLTIICQVYVIFFGFVWHQIFMNMVMSLELQYYMNCSLCTHHNFNIEIQLFIKRKSNWISESRFKVNDWPCTTLIFSLFCIALKKIIWYFFHFPSIFNDSFMLLTSPSPFAQERPKWWVKNWEIVEYDCREEISEWKEGKERRGAF